MARAILAMLALLAAPVALADDCYRLNTDPRGLIRDLVREAKQSAQELEFSPKERRKFLRCMRSSIVHSVRAGQSVCPVTGIVDMVAAFQTAHGYCQDGAADTEEETTPADS